MSTGSFLALQLSTCHCMRACWSRTALCSRRPVLQQQPRAQASLLALRFIEVRLLFVRCSAMASVQDLAVCLPMHACMLEPHSFVIPATSSATAASGAGSPVITALHRGETALCQALSCASFQRWTLPCTAD